jgi:hypothetical protein
LEWIRAALHVSASISDGAHPVAVAVG